LVFISVRRPDESSYTFRNNFSIFKYSPAPDHGPNHAAFEGATHVRTLLVVIEKTLAFNGKLLAQIDKGEIGVGAQSQPALAGTEIKTRGDIGGNHPG